MIIGGFLLTVPSDAPEVACIQRRHVMHDILVRSLLLLVIPRDVDTLKAKRSLLDASLLKVKHPYSDISPSD